MMEEFQLRYIVSTYVNITIYHPVQLLYANKIIKEQEQDISSNKSY
jgi:hypothetical protein